MRQLVIRNIDKIVFKDIPHTDYFISSVSEVVCDSGSLMYVLRVRSKNHIHQSHLVRMNKDIYTLTDSNMECIFVTIVGRDDEELITGNIHVESFTTKERFLRMLYYNFYTPKKP